MFKRRAVVGLAALMLVHPWAAFAQDAQPKQSLTTSQVMTDAAIIAAIIAPSIAAYRAGGPGPCACPDDTDRIGHRCGKRSAHDRPGGWVVQCSAADVTIEMIKGFRSRSASASLK